LRRKVVTETANISIDDAILVERCRYGDSAAIEQLILKYQNRIYNVILKICANTDDAAELTQDTFVKVIENIDKFEGRSSFYTWTFRIAVNLALSYCQRNAKLGFRSLDSEDNEHNQQAKGALKEFLGDESSRNPAEVAANKELCKIVLTALMKLDDAQRAVIVLRDIEGMNYNRIAEVLDIELGTVKSRLSRARSNLRKVLEAVLR
jgi:RNA polymerase sigma-70 factor (ECF subfamily)